MTAASGRKAVVPGGPVNHSAYLLAVQKAVNAVGRGARPWVQVRKRMGGEQVVLCGQVAAVDAGPDSGEWFKVQTDLGTLWIESRNMRMCSGDGRCTCEADHASKAREGVPSRAPLPGPGQADWRSGRAAVCPAQASTQEPCLHRSAGEVACSA